MALKSVNKLTKNTDIRTTLAAVKHQVQASAQKASRDPESVQLLAVSKKKPLADIEAAWVAGQHAFGENYVDEALEKIQTWRSAHPDWRAEWHFIGSIQSRKAAAIATHFDWAHSVDRLKVAQKLSQHRPAELPPLSVCLQVNLDEEASKSGVPANQVLELANQVAELPQLRLRGLMSIPAPREGFDAQRAVFRELADLLNTLKESHPALDTLSMGMSADLDAAIAEGATLVRVGTAIFGARLR